MKSEEIKTLFAQFERASGEIEGIECWSARELQNLLGYSKWENFSKVIDKAKESCLNAGEKISDHFPDVRKTISMPKGAEKEMGEILQSDELQTDSTTRKIRVVQSEGKREISRELDFYNEVEANSRK